MRCVIATRPNRVVRNWRNNVQKYAQVRYDGKFRFVTDLNEATLFTSTPEALRALAVRGAKLRNPGGTSRNNYGQDLTIAEVEETRPAYVPPVPRGGLRVTRFLNGH